jgi:hypothetical protein
MRDNIFIIGACHNTSTQTRKTEQISRFLLPFYTVVVTTDFFDAFHINMYVTEVNLLHKPNQVILRLQYSKQCRIVLGVR